MDRYILAAVEPLIQKDLLPGDPDAKGKMGLLATAFLVSYMVFAPLLGALADRMSRWLLVGLSVIVWSLATGAGGLAPTFAILILTRCIVGVGEAGYGPAAPTIISDLYPAKRRGSVLAWFYMAIPVGSALGFALGGQLGEIFQSWRVPFYAMVLPGLALACFAFLMPNPRRGGADDLEAADDEKAIGLADGYRALLRNKSYLFNTMGMTMMTFAIGGVSYWMPRYLSETRGAASLGSASTILGAIVVVCGLFSTLLGGMAGDWLRERWKGAYFLVSGTGMLIGFPCFLAVLYAPFPLAWGFLGLAIFWLFFNTGPSNTIIANCTHPSLRASGFALNIFVIHALGDAISPPIIGTIADRTKSLQDGFLAVAGAIVLSGIFWILGSRYYEADAEAARRRPNAN